MNVLVLCSLLLMSCSVYAFIINEVVVRSPYPISDDQDVIISVMITTGSSPTFLRKPTEVVRDRNMVTITQFPDMGNVSALSSYMEMVNLGRLGVGTNLFVVKLQPPDDQVGGPFQIVGGNLMIYPKLRIRKFQDQIEFRWSASGAGSSFYLEFSDQLGEKANWKFSNLNVREEGSDLVMVLPIVSSQAYYRLKQRALLSGPG